jgi:hypothetical protein
MFGLFGKRLRGRTCLATCPTRIYEIRLGGVDMSSLTGVFGGRIDF